MPRTVAALIVLAATFSLTCGPVLAVTEPRDAASTELVRELTVPVDHDDPGAGVWRMTCLLAAPFDTSRSTICVVGDGQQFHVRAGRMTQVVERLGVADVNVVGIPGRIAEATLADLVTGSDGEVDWPKAARVFSSRQWCGDIDAVRRDLLGPQGRLQIIGSSGGGLLVQEYLARHPDGCARAFIESGLNPALDARRGVVPDRFWDELVAADPALGQRLQAGLKGWPEQRLRIATAFSRQHYFHTAAALDSARAALVDVVARRDQAAFEAACAQYQVDAVNALLQGRQGIAVAVRMYEFHQPAIARVDLSGPRFYPTLEMAAAVAAPLLELHAAGLLPAPELDVEALRAVTGEVFLLAARWDQPVWYESQQDLAALIPEARLLLVDDDHVFKNLRGAGLDAQLRTAFFRDGLRGAALEAVLRRAEPLRWRP